MAELPVWVPPIDEQRILADYLDRKTEQIDTLIARKERLIELLQEQRTAIINRAVTKGLDPDAPMKDSGIEWLGEVPAHWDMIKMKWIADLKSGDSITASEIDKEGDYPVYGGNGLRGYTSSFTHDGHHVLIGRQGALCGNINYASGQYWASEHAVVCTLRTHYNVKWFGELLRSMNLRQYSQAAAQPGISVERIGNLKIPVPSVDEQNRLSAFLNESMTGIDRVVARERSLIEKLQELRTSLISEVVTGKIDVRKEARVEVLA